MIDFFPIILAKKSKELFRKVKKTFHYSLIQPTSFFFIENISNCPYFWTICEYFQFICCDHWKLRWPLRDLSRSRPIHWGIVKNQFNSIQFNVVEKQNQSLQFKNGKALINLYEKCNWKGKMFSLYFKSAKKDCRLQFFFFSVENVIVKASKSTAIGQLLD